MVESVMLQVTVSKTSNLVHSRWHTILPLRTEVGVNQPRDLSIACGICHLPTSLLSAVCQLHCPSGVTHALVHIGHLPRQT